jgi:hypothetical protein
LNLFHHGSAHSRAVLFDQIARLFLQHHVNPEHAAHHAAAASKDIAYDGKMTIDDDVGLPTSKDAGNS